MIVRPRTLVWLGAYVAFAVLPLALCLIDLDPGRGFWINFSVAMGFVALSMLGLQFLLAARTRIVSDNVGMDVVLRFHRQITYVAFALVFAHPIVLFVYNTAFLQLLNIFEAPLRARLGVTSAVLLIVLVVSSVWRSRLRLKYSTWQAIHAVLAVAIVLTAMGHAVLVGYYVREPWETFLWVVLSFAFVGLGVWVRIIKPILRRRRRWIVDSVRPEAGGATTVTMHLADPLSYGEQGFIFRAGQFAWILVRHSPFAMTYHPFSFSSSAEHPEHISFTIKAFGQFTHDVAELRAGDSVYVDGPYGSFTVDEVARPLVFIGGGVGVTPLLSMLATLADRGDTRPCFVFLANRDLDNRTCGEAIDELRPHLDLTVIDVLQSPPPGWSGESGHLGADIMRTYLPSELDDAQFFVCGPPGLMDAVDGMLADLGVPAAHVQAERFGMV